MHSVHFSEKLLNEISLLAEALKIGVGKKKLVLHTLVVVGIQLRIDSR